MYQNGHEIVKVIIAGTLLMLFLGSNVIFFVVAYKRKQSRYQREKFIMEQKFEQELLRTQLEIQEQTFKNISQEIHDNIGQTLSLVKLNLNTIDVNNQDAAREKITNSKDLVGKAIQDLRSLSKTLNTDTILAAGFLKAVEFELGLIDKAGGYHTLLEITGSTVKMDPQKELILFRIVQEALNNIIKHAQAQNIRVQCLFQEQHFTLTIEDDGGGFEESQSFVLEQGSGLQNMQNRALLLGGHFELSRTSVPGTCIKITVPYNEL